MMGRRLGVGSEVNDRPRYICLLIADLIAVSLLKRMACRYLLLQFVLVDNGMKVVESYPDLEMVMWAEEYVEVSKSSVN